LPTTLEISEIIIRDPAKAGKRLRRCGETATW
jgi:hypothetical protein